MASPINRRNRRLTKVMSSEELDLLIRRLEPQVRDSTSLLECAKQELTKRAKLRRQQNNEHN